MSEKIAYEAKTKAQFDECKTQVEKFKTEALNASEHAKVEMHKHIKQLEEKMSEGQTKLAELVASSEDKFESMKKGVESIWQSTKSTLHHASKHFGK